MSQASPPGLIDGAFEDNLFTFELCHRGIEVVAHQVEVVAGFVAGVKCDLARGQGEDQPALAGVDGVETEDFLEEDSICFGVLAVHDDVGSGNHAKQSRKVGKDWEEGVVWLAWVVFMHVLGLVACLLGTGKKE